MTYYLFRLVNPSIPHFEVTKWDGGKKPVDKHSVYPTTQSCNCQASKRDCKHVRLCLDLLDPEFINETDRWGWDEERGWFELHDAPDKEALDALFALL